MTGNGGFTADVIVGSDTLVLNLYGTVPRTQSVRELRADRGSVGPPHAGAGGRAAVWRLPQRVCQNRNNGCVQRWPVPKCDCA
jgi:hypothetical protein